MSAIVKTFQHISDKHAPMRSSLSDISSEASSQISDDYSRCKDRRKLVKQVTNIRVTNCCPVVVGRKAKIEVAQPRDDNHLNLPSTSAAQAPPPPDPSPSEVVDAVTDTEMSEENITQVGENCQGSYCPVINCHQQCGTEKEPKCDARPGQGILFNKGGLEFQWSIKTFFENPEKFIQEMDINACSSKEEKEDFILHKILPHLEESWGAQQASQTTNGDREKSHDASQACCGNLFGGRWWRRLEVLLLAASILSDIGMNSTTKEKKGLVPPATVMATNVLVETKYASASSGGMHSLQQLTNQKSASSDESSQVITETRFTGGTCMNKKEPTKMPHHNYENVQNRNTYQPMIRYDETVVSPSDDPSRLPCRDGKNGSRPSVHRRADLLAAQDCVGVLNCVNIFSDSC
ncbi:hypothetical protein OS493_026494 [Desmophyllum pertusum]|uniref:Uncharacterized protein n=1 Tax=Desmophyllum pertusum TaxID=174260 RepID=A0A9W9YKY9_9CNID|nr:hypothetical protein OS493_026494 [Desmophyllum pertusum]